MSEFKHVSVLLDESIEGLNIKPDGIYVDGTLGRGGHTKEIAKQLTTGTIIGIDQDEDAILAATQNLQDYKDKVIIVRGNYKDIDLILNDLNIEKVDGILLDLGVSSYQLDKGERGFSYHQDYPLDMRMDQRSSIDAEYIVNNYTENELADIIFNYGEDRWAKRIAKFIVNERKTKTIKTTLELVDVIKKAIPVGARDKHPAIRTFQALRIEVNKELEVLENSIGRMIDLLNKEGRLAIITFHSLEDRIVKNLFREKAKDCICDPLIPICVCDTVPQVKVLTRKPIMPTDEEIKSNNRSRSAKLRIVEKI